MAYIWKTILRRENHEFILCKNRHNSKTSFIIAFPKGKNSERTIGTVNNKTNIVVINDAHGFKEKTISDLKNALQ